MTETPQSKPKHRIVFDTLLSQIQSGLLSAGDPLPTEMQLVDQFGFSRQTIRQALGDLESGGLIERVQGRGTFVSQPAASPQRSLADIFAYIAPELQTGIYPWMLGGFQASCAEYGLQTLIGNSHDDLGQQADLLMQMMDQRVGGVALVPTTTPPTPVHQIRVLQAHQVPVVFCHRTVHGVRAPAVLIDGYDIGLTAGRTLRDLGHRRIGFFYNHRYSMTDDYGRGLRRAFSDADLDLDAIQDVEYEASPAFEKGKVENAIQAELKTLLNRRDPPTAIFCGNPPMAEMIYLHAVSSGVKVPAELSILCVGSRSREHGLVEKLATIAIDENALGARAAEMLQEMRSGRRPIDSTEAVIFPPSLLKSETLAQAPRDRRRSARAG